MSAFTNTPVGDPAAEETSAEIAIAAVPAPADDEKPDWQDLTKEDIERAAEEASEALRRRVLEELEGRFGRSFAIRQILAEIGDGTVRMIARDDAEPSVPFSVRVDPEGNIGEDYVRNLAVRTLCRVMEDTFPEAAACAAVLDDGTLQETDTSLTLSGYLCESGERRVLLRMIFPQGAAPDCALLLSAAEEASRFHDADIALRVWLIPAETFAALRELFHSLPSVSETIIGRHAPAASFSAMIRDGRSSLSAEEAAGLLEVH